MSPAHDQEYFADGMAEELLGALSRIPGLKVTGRTSSFAFKNRDVDLRTIAAQLGVTHILEGSVRTSGQNLRVTAKLINAEDGFQVWSQEFNGDLSDIFVVQDEISRQVVAGLKLHIGTGGVHQTPRMATTGNMQAYDEYLLGRYHLARRTPESMLQADKSFRAAIASDPNYSPAYSALAITLAISPYYRGVESSIALAAEAKDLALRAIELNQQNGEAFAALGFISLIFERDWSTAADSLARAVELHPNDALNANFYGDFLYTIGDYQQAEIYEKRAAELDPLSAANQHELALVYGLLGRWQEALALEKIALQLNPDFQNARSTLARILLENGSDDELTTWLETSAVSMGESAGIWIRARQQMIAGNREAALIETERLVRLHEEQGRSQVSVAMLYALLNEDVKASALLEKAYLADDPILISPLYFFLPEDWPGLSLVQQALDKPDLVKLYDLRRANIAAGRGRVLSLPSDK